MLPRELVSGDESSGGHVEWRIEGGLLMRILTIAQCAGLVQREGLEIVGVQPVGNCAIVGNKFHESMAAQLVRELGGHGAALRIELGDKIGVLRDIRKNGNMRTILDCGAHHGRTAHINVLVDFFRGFSRRKRMLEGIEVDDEQVNGIEAQALHVGDVTYVITPREQAAMNARMQRFDTSLHRFRVPGELRDFGDRQAVIKQRFGSAAGSDQLNVVGVQGLREFNETSLIADR